jgi:NAD(P)-dependent dehydrogenase (short-subunit alcohol dehydrogenase family)
MTPDQNIALVTGANRGIGFETCRQHARLGILVILTSRDEAKGQAAQKKLVAEGLDVTFHQLDVTEDESIRGLATFVKKEYKRLDILVNNAGVYIDNQSSLLRMEMDIFHTTMTTNLHGPIILCQAFIPLMEQQGYGRVVNVSSGAAQISDRLSKAALNAMTRILADELRGTNVLVNSMCPGWVRTDMGGRAAPRSVEKGADTIIWLATLPGGGPQSGFFRDRAQIPW